MLNEFGVTIKEKRNKFVVLKRKNLSSNFEEYPIEGDWSNAAFFIAAGCLGQRIRVIQLKNDSLQGDKEVLQLLMKAGANISVNDKDYLAESSKLKAFNYDFTDNPDLFPVMSIVAAFAKGTSKLTGGRRLRFKESDRINSTFQMLKNLGANVDRTENGLTIEGKEMLEGGKVHSFCDHRIVMAAAIASIRCKKPVSIIKAESVSKSYPNFFEEFERIGGKVSVIG